MAFKKKKIASDEVPDLPEVSSSREEESARSPMMTQVVEVVDESQPQPLEPKEADIPQKEQSEEKVAEAIPSKRDEGSVAEEINKELVDDLFQTAEVATMPEISVHHKKTSRALRMWSIVLIVSVIVIGIGLLFARGGVSLPGVAVITPTPTLSPTAMPTPTPVPPKREDVTIEVLNGGGKAGAASGMKSVLEKLGYKVGDTGNTDEFSFETTEIQVKAGQSGLLEMLREDLKADYAVSDSSTPLPETAEFDARVIVGKE